MFIGYISRRIMLAILLTICLSSASVIYGSELITHEIDSREIAGNLVGISSLLTFQVYLPDEYYDKEYERYPVLYYIPGWLGMRWENYRNPLDDAIKSGTIPSTIAVFIDVRGQWFLNSPAFGNWENFITQEVIPFVDKNYRTIADPLARGLMGASSGGYTALMLPVRNPGVWSSIGMNDPSLWGMWLYIRDEADIIYRELFSAIPGGYKDLPKDIADYGSVGNFYTIDLLQFGTAFSPNSDSPLLCDLPLDVDGEWVPEVREKWSEYDLSNPQTLAQHSDTLRNLLSLTIVVPELSKGSNRDGNLDFIERLKSGGISVTRLDMPGAHDDGGSDRFIAMAEQLLRAMEGAETAVSPQASMTVTWGAIKQGQ